MNTLVYHYGGLGDFITILPFLSHYRKFRQSKNKVQSVELISIKADTITLIGKPHQGALAQCAGIIDKTLDADSSLFLPLFKEKSVQTQIEQLLKEYDSIIIFSPDDSPLLKNAKKHTAATVFHQNPFPLNRTHIIDYHLSLIKNRYPYKNSSNTTINIPEILINQVKSYIGDSKKVAILSPGSGSARKNWPIENFLRLRELLKNKDITTIWILGPAEKDFNCPYSDTVISNMDLPHLAALISLCDIYIGNDSGTTHLAAICGSPVLALFGPSDPVIWSPRGKNINILYKSPHCGPCHPNKKNVNCDQMCMYSITVEEVANKTESIVKRSKQVFKKF